MLTITNKLDNKTKRRKQNKGINIKDQLQIVTKISQFKTIK